MTELRLHPAIKAYFQHGFLPIDETETEIFGNCPFCGKNSKLYVNKSTKAWDCKSCSRNGGFLTFLEKINEKCQLNFKGSIAIKLSKSRSISIKTLKEFGMGYNEITNNYCFPVFDVRNKRIHDLRIFKNGKLLSTQSCKTGLLNWGKLMNCKGTIWLCEGEWDGMVMQELLNKLGLEKDIATAVPGAGTFKSDWIPLFIDKKVNVIYDNDEPGQKGALKVFNILKADSKKLQFVNWDESFETNFDLRDLYKQIKTSKATMKKIGELLKDLPMMADVEEIMREGARAKKEYDGDGMLPEDVYNSYTRWLYMPDTSAIDIMYGAVLANRLDGDPLWLFLVAPPGMTKTTLLQTIADCDEVVAVSTLTPHSLISGSNAGGVDPSLIPRLDGKVLTIKDFTTILNMHIQAREEIFGVLRDAYDTEVTKTFGHGIRRHYKSKFGIVAGVTPAIETFLETESALGERFLRFAMKLPKSTQEHLEFMRRATLNIKDEKMMRDTMRELGAKVLNHSFDTNIHIPDKIYTKILYLSMWTAQLRGTIIRDKFSKEVLFKPFQELGTRLSKQFMKLLIGICMFRRLKEAGENEFRIIRKVALSTVPSKLENAVKSAYKYGIDRNFTVGELGEMIQLPTSTTQQVVNSLYMLGAFTKVKLSAVKTDWKLCDKFIDISERGGIL